MTRMRVWGIAGILLGIAAWIGAGAIALSAFGSVASWQAPGTESVTLTPGTWSVFQLVDADSGAITPGQVAQERTVTVDQLSVTSPSAQSMELSCLYCDGQDPVTAPVDLQLANGIASFRVAEAGNYSVTVTDTTSSMAIADPVEQLNDVISYAAMLGIGGGFLITIGIVLVAKGRTRGVQADGGHGSARTTTDPSPPAALTGAGVAAEPGWYPNPYQPDTDSQMWWDGKQWTSNWR
ncbi:MAG: hypothetical protein ACJAY5_001806 [Actinomycetes bacterium]|jgi:hypothetical protein